MMLMVWPNAASAISDDSTASGIEIAMITVERQLPRNSRIIAAVRPAAIKASRTTPRIAELTKTDWSDTGVTVSARGRLGAIAASLSLTCSMMVSVDALPLFSICSSAARLPSARTMLVWGT